MSVESEVSNWKYSHFLENEKNNFNKNSSVTDWEKNNTLDC